MRLGISRRQAIRHGKSRKGYWHMAKTIAGGVGMTNKWLQEQGLVSLKSLWASLAQRFVEPPGAVPHARWCGEGGQKWPSLPDSVAFLLNRNWQTKTAICLRFKLDDISHRIQVDVPINMREKLISAFQVFIADLGIKSFFVNAKKNKTVLAGKQSIRDRNRLIGYCAVNETLIMKGRC
jgi:hypothetical protein